MQAGEAGSGGGSPERTSTGQAEVLLRLASARAETATGSAREQGDL